MCYSAMVEQRFKEFIRRFGARIDIHTFARLYGQRLTDKSIKIPRALDANFAEPKTPLEKQIKEAIEQYRAQQAKEWEEGLFAQRTRLVNAERTLKTRETKKALDDRRIAANKIEWYRDKLGALRSPEPRPDDARIFPMWYAPVVIVENGEYVVKPMRYHCRPGGKPESFDKKFDGLYNARRDSLDKFWKRLFGQHHGFFIAESFYENVALHDFEKRPLRPDEKPGNVVLHFNPRQPEPMLVACLWDLWTATGKPELLSFSAITDDPPAEVAATGHDRCIVPLKPENLPLWMNPDGVDRQKLDALLEDRERPYYEHRLAA